MYAVIANSYSCFYYIYFIKKLLCPRLKLFTYNTCLVKENTFAKHKNIIFLT